nr:hypothetical protein [Aliikangiella coralliicola]
MMGQVAQAQDLYRSDHEAPPVWLRSAVKNLLDNSDSYRQLEDSEKRSLARAMVKVSDIAAKLIAEENLAQSRVEQEQKDHPQSEPSPTARALSEQSDQSNAEQSDTAQNKVEPILARAQSQPGFGESANRIAGVTQSVLNAVSFPRFVTDLVNGVFTAMLDSTSQQMQMYVELLNNVSASVSGFEQTQFSANGVRQWLLEQFPGSFELEGGESDFEDEEPDEDDEVEPARLRLRSGGTMPSQDAMRAVFGMEPEENVTASNPEQLVPFARRQIARQRQQMLATMVTLGMQRIVIDSGKINASMRFHIDTRSAASEDRGREFGMQNRVRASGSFGVGPWGASAEVENNISYVSTQRSQRTEEINTDLELNSSVELNFRTDYLPLNQMAASAQAERIRQASLNPTPTTDTTANNRAVRQREQRAAEQQRAQRISNLTPPAMATTPLTPPTPNSRQTPQGQTPQGQTPQGQTPQGQTPQGQTPQGQTPQGQTPQGQTPQGQTPQGQTPQGQAPQGQTPQGQS